MEHELIEERTGLWKEVLQELAAASGKANVDQALKVSSCYNEDKALKVGGCYDVDRAPKASGIFHFSGCVVFEE
jgi:hypothetical protein